MEKRFDGFMETIEKFGCYFCGFMKEETGEINGHLESLNTNDEAEVKEILTKAGFKGSVESDPEETNEFIIDGIA